MTKRKSKLRRFLSVLGPGLITGAADDDPSGIATYSIAGAQMGTSLLWTAFITWPLMAFARSRMRAVCREFDQRRRRPLGHGGRGRDAYGFRFALLCFDLRDRYR